MAVMKIGANVIKIYNMDLEKLGGCASPKLKHFSNTGDRGGKVGLQVSERSESIRGRKKHRIDMGPSKKNHHGCFLGMTVQCLSIDCLDGEENDRILVKNLTVMNVSFLCRARAWCGGEDDKPSTMRSQDTYRS